MIEKRLFKRMFVLLIVVAVLSVIDRNLYLTWNFWWFDKMMHFIAGISVGMAVILTMMYFQKFLDNKLKMLFFSIIGVLIVGLLWELFELYFGITFLSDGLAYYKDTITDLSMDTIGGILGTIYSYRFIKK
ncbi:MAG: putative membrane protein (4 TMH) [Parcubacteria bacterium C7867-006]|nr:MAG: putative membrane protein (4 TMH) [Parcubacteria bacterium C7867-006]